MFKPLIATALFAMVATPVLAQSPGVGGAPNPVGVRTPQSITITPVTMAANTSARLIAANPTRKSIQILNIGTGFCTAMSYPATGTYTVTQNVGYPLEPASATGHQGGSTPIYDGASTSTDEWDAICTGATTLLVIEGN